MKRRILGFLVISAFCLQIISLPSVAEAGRPLRNIIITSPAPYQTLMKGINTPITWESRNVSSMNLYFRDKQTGVKTLIRENVSAEARTAYWAIPTSLADGEYDIILEDQMSSTNHTIQVKLNGQSARTIGKPTQALTLTSTNGGSFNYGSPVQITWSHSGLGNNSVEIYLGAAAQNGQITWTQIASGVPGNWNQYTWYPDRTLINKYLAQQGITNGNFKILINDRNNYNAKDTSDAFFTLK